MPRVAVRRSVSPLAGPLTSLALVVLAGFGGCVIEERPFNDRRVSCPAYCAEVMRKCPEGYAVYESEAECLAVCDRLPLGEAGGEPGNTVHCRLELLQAADFEIEIGCPAAGPGGNGMCGSNCEAFCGLRQSACASVDPSDFDISRPGFCDVSCPGLADTGRFSIQSARSTDTLQCRLTHLSRTLASQAVGDTAQALDACIQSQTIPETRESVCTDSLEQPRDEDCAMYCQLVMTSCRDDLSVYVDEAQCMDTCATFARGEHGDIAVNTLRCRRYHSYAALGGPVEHCAHAGPTGDGHCGPRDEGNCLSHCGILKKACNVEYQRRYGPVDMLDPADLGECVPNCLGLPNAGYNGFTLPPRYTTSEPPGPGTLKCQTYYAVQALAAPNDAEACLAAFGDPDSSCGTAATAR